MVFIHPKVDAAPSLIFETYIEMLSRLIPWGLDSCPLTQPLFQSRVTLYQCVVCVRSTLRNVSLSYDVMSHLSSFWCVGRSCHVIRSLFRPNSVGQIIDSVPVNGESVISGFLLVQSDHLQMMSFSHYRLSNHNTSSCRSDFSYINHVVYIGEQILMFVLVTFVMSRQPSLLRGSLDDLWAGFLGKNGPFLLTTQLLLLSFPFPKPLECQLSVPFPPSGTFNDLHKFNLEARWFIYFQSGVGVV
ncbi:6207_t:CDS:2, partial [Acaulospora morrowiae]